MGILPPSPVPSPRFRTLQNLLGRVVLHTWRGATPGHGSKGHGASPGTFPPGCLVYAWQRRNMLTMAAMVLKLCNFARPLLFCTYPSLHPPYSPFRGYPIGHFAGITEPSSSNGLCSDHSKNQTIPHVQ
jgi:hypothetical protein